MNERIVVGDYVEVKFTDTCMIRGYVVHQDFPRETSAFRPGRDSGPNAVRLLFSQINHLTKFTGYIIFSPQAKVIKGYFNGIRKNSTSKD